MRRYLRGLMLYYFRYTGRVMSGLNNKYQAITRLGRQVSGLSQDCRSLSIPLELSRPSKTSGLESYGCLTLLSLELSRPNQAMVKTTNTRNSPDLADFFFLTGLRLAMGTCGWR